MAASWTTRRMRLLAVLLCVSIAHGLQAQVPQFPDVQEQEKAPPRVSGHCPAAAPVESHTQVIERGRQSADGTKTRNAPFTPFLTVATYKSCGADLSESLTIRAHARGSQSCRFLIPPDRAPPALIA